MVKAAGVSITIRVQRGTLAGSLVGAGAWLHEQLAVFAAWVKATVVPKPTLFPRRGGLLVLQHYEDLFGGDKVAGGKFKAQFDAVGDNVLWLPDGITATYYPAPGEAVELAKRRGMVPSPPTAPKRPARPPAPAPLFHPLSSEGEAES